MTLNVCMAVFRVQSQENLTERYAVLVIGGGGGRGMGVCRKREINTKERTTTKCRSLNSTCYR